MKRKPAPTDPDPLVPKEILDEARRLSETDKIRRTDKCSVCGDECAPNSTEGLCWVCRRLKISAWKDNDVQMGMQE